MHIRLEAHHYARVFLYLSLLTAGLLNFVPSFLDISLYCFLFSYFLFLFFSACLFFRNPSLDIVGIAICCFILLLFTNSLVALANGVVFLEFIRAIVPFLFFLTYPLMLNIFTKDHNKLLYHMILLSCVVWLAQLLFAVGIDFVSIISGNVGRLSYITKNIFVPYSLIGLCLTLYSPILQKWIKLFLGSLFFVVIALSGYRSQLLLSVFTILVFFSRGRLARGCLFTILTLSTVMGFAALLNLPAWQRLTEFGLGNNSVRLAELHYALARFVESPVYGKGLGFSIPIYDTRPIEIAARFDKEVVAYMHNLVGYFLMDTGVLVTALIVFVVAYPMFRAIPCVSFYRTRNIFAGSFLAAFNMLAFFMISASFRQVQSVVAICTLFIIINRERRIGQVYVKRRVLTRTPVVCEGEGRNVLPYPGLDKLK